MSDLYAIKDHSARGRAAVKVLEELGYEVSLDRRSGPPPKEPAPRLRVVDSSKDEARLESRQSSWPAFVRNQS